MQWTFEEIHIGATATFDRTISEIDIKKFVELTGDDNPLHVDPHYALTTSFKKPVVHGMLTASFISTIVGKYLPGPGALWVSQHVEFNLPVRVGDTLKISAEVINKHSSQRMLTLKMEVRNQHDQIILKGEGKVKMLETEKKQVQQEALQKITLITGASRGIGAKTATYLAKAGHWLVINYVKSSDDAKDVLSEIENTGGRAMLYQADVSNATAVEEMLNHVKNKFGLVTGLVCNAANKIIAKDFASLTWQDIETHINVQLKGTFNCIKAVLPHFLANKTGSTVVVGSIVTDNVPPAKWIDYTLAKSALHSLTKSLALEYGPQGIRFNVISPGMTDTGFIADLPEKAKMLTAMQTPLRRLAKPQDIAQAIAFLLNDESSFISGENLRVCGGQVML